MYKILAVYAIGVSQGFIYVRAEYPLAVGLLEYSCHIRRYCSEGRHHGFWRYGLHG